MALKRIAKERGSGFALLEIGTCLGQNRSLAATCLLCVSGQYSNLFVMLFRGKRVFSSNIFRYNISDPTIYSIWGSQLCTRYKGAWNRFPPPELPPLYLDQDVWFSLKHLCIFGGKKVNIYSPMMTGNKYVFIDKGQMVLTQLLLFASSIKTNCAVLL